MSLSLKKLIKKAFLRCHCLTIALCLTALLPFAAEAKMLRVALVSGQYSAEISCDDDFLVRDSRGAEIILAKGKYFLHVLDKKLVLGEHELTDIITIMALEGKKTPTVNQRTYKGYYQAQRQGELLLVNNLLDLEEYLYSVMPAKTLPVWPVEVIKAQAIAARSYALYQAQENASLASDLNANDKELKYEGTGKRIEKIAISKLVHDTSGLFLADAFGAPIYAVSTSSSGGRTEPGAYAYLPSVEDRDSDAPEFTWERQFAPFLVQGLLEQRGYSVGKLRSIRLTPLKDAEAQWGSDRTKSTGRVKYLIFSGDAGTAKISGEEFAELLDLNSTLFDIDTGVPIPETIKVPISNYWGMEIGHKDIPIKINEEDVHIWKDLARSYHLISGHKEEKLRIHGYGKGNGIGLSAWGARGLYNENEKITYREILSYYYPGTSLRHLNAAE